MSGSMQNSSSEKLFTDIMAASKLAGVEPNADKVKSTLELFSEEFAQGAVQLRTSTKDITIRNVNFRHVIFDEAYDPFEKAKQNDLLGDQDRAVVKAADSIRSNFRLMGCGVDCSVKAGLEKIWFFLDRPYLVGEIAERASQLPDSIRESIEKIAAYDFRSPGLVAFDFIRASANLYFAAPALDAFPAPRIDALLREFGLGEGAPPQTSTYASRGGSSINLTFTWTDPGPQRICFYEPVLDVSSIPVSEDPILETFAEKSPFSAPARHFIFGVTFKKGGYYLKLTSDYNGLALGTPTEMGLYQKWGIKQQEMMRG